MFSNSEGVEKVGSFSEGGLGLDNGRRFRELRQRVPPIAYPSMTLELFQIDAFAEKIFEGNPAAVIPVEEWLPKETMQAIAMENQLSETAFLRIASEAYELRWFTPTIEVDLCGHATLAAAHVLFEILKVDGDSVSFQTRSGVLTVRRDREGYAMSLPADPPKPLDAHHETLGRALGVQPLSILRGRDDLVAIFETEQQVQNLDPDFGLIATLPFRGLIVSAPGKSVDFVSRCFFPQSGIDEDPVTGSAHATLAPFWLNHFQTNQDPASGLRAKQLSSRGGQVECRVLGDRVILIGNAVTYLRGQVSLPGLD